MQSSSVANDGAAYCCWSELPKSTPTAEKKIKDASFFSLENRCICSDTVGRGLVERASLVSQLQCHCLGTNCKVVFVGVGRDWRRAAGFGEDGELELQRTVLFTNCSKGVVGGWGEKDVVKPQTHIWWQFSPSRLYPPHTWNRSFCVSFRSERSAIPPMHPLGDLPHCPSPPSDV